MNAPPQVKAPGEVGTSNRAHKQTDRESVAAFDRLVRRFDTRGITLERLPSGEFVAHQASWCRLLADMEAVQRFARLLGV